MADVAMESIAQCAVCGCAELTPVLEGSDLLCHLPGQFRLVGCAGCGVLYQDPRPTPEEIGAFYPDSYGSYASAEAGIRGRPWLQRMLIYRAQGLRARMIDRAVAPHPPHPRRLLDIGCASGLFLEVMQQQAGWEVAGLELNAQAAHSTAERLGIDVFAGPLEAAEYPDGSFDAITLWDVLEHFHDPLAALDKIRRMLRPGGVIMVRVPNTGSYLRRLAGRHWVGYDLPRHMTLFNLANLSLLLERNGFEAPLESFTSGSYISALHSLRFAMDDGWVAPERAARIHRVLLSPLLRVPLRGGLWAADWLWGGSNLEAVARVQS